MADRLHRDSHASIYIAWGLAETTIQPYACYYDNGVIFRLSCHTHDIAFWSTRGNTMQDRTIEAFYCLKTSLPRKRPCQNHAVVTQLIAQLVTLPALAFSSRHQDEDIRPQQWSPLPFIYIHIHTYIHTCMRAYICKFMHTHTHSHIHTLIHTYIHTYIHSFICIRICLCSYSCLCKQLV